MAAVTAGKGKGADQMESSQHHPERNRFQQWLRIAGVVFFAMTLLFVIMMVALWQYRTPLLNDIARPHIERFLSTELEALVTIDQLALEAGQLSVRGMTVDHAGFYRVAVSALFLDFNIGKLWRGQLSSLQVEQPELYLNPAFSLGKGEDAPFTLSKPPVSIDLLQISGGRFDLVLKDQVVAIRSIEFAMNHAPSGDFQLSFAVQGDTPLKLSANGLLQWGTTPELQLNEINIDGDSLLTAPLILSFSSDGLAAGGELMLEQFERAQLDPWLALGGVQQGFPADFDFSVQDLRLGVEIVSGQVLGRFAAAALRLTKEDYNVHLSNLQLYVSGDPNHWHAAGEAHLAEGAPLSFDAQGEDGHIVATAKGTFLNLARVPELLGKEQVLPISGALQWAARASWRDEVLALSGDFLGLPSESTTSAASLNLSQVRGRFQANGPLDHLLGKLTIDLAESPLLTLEGHLDEMNAELHRTSLSSLASMVASSLWPHVVEKRGWVAGNVQLQPAADNPNGRFDFTAEGLRAAGFEFGESRITSRFLWQQEQLALSDLKLQSSMTGHGVSIPVATVQGVARWRSPAMSLDIAALHMDKLEYLAADDMSAVAGGSLALAGTVAWDGVQQRLHARVQGSAQVEEALVHSFYGDLSQLPVNFHLQADWHAVTESLQVDEIKLALPDIGQLKGHGNWNTDALDFGGELLFPQLEHGFSQHLLPLLASLYPGLEQLELNGTLAAAGDGAFETGRWHIDGVFSPDTIGLKHRTLNISMSGLSGEIPFAFSSDGRISDSARSGFVTFTQLEAGPVVSDVNDLTLRSTTNRLTFVDPWKLNLADGRILIEDLSFGHESADLFVSGRTHIDSIDLQQLTQVLELTPMQGSLTADLGEFKYIGGLLQSEGEARIDVFGGTIEIRNLRARDIFSSYRSFEGDIDFHGIDLEQLTRTFEFGEINGIIDGYIHELRMFGKIPSAFVAEIATRDQGERNISVKALNNLTVISQGGLSAALSRGVYRFIDFYRYRKIGLFCALRNDVFVLKGTARSDSDLHLVDGGLLPPRINVLAPGTGVSFREMLRRLERIDRTATR